MDLLDSAFSRLALGSNSSEAETMFGSMDISMAEGRYTIGWTSASRSLLGEAVNLNLYGGKYISRRDRTGRTQTYISSERNLSERNFREISQRNRVDILEGQR